MIEQVFTFGYGHTCPYTGERLADHYATIIAPDKEQCRALMVGLFGSQWAFPYDSVADASPAWLRAPLVEHLRIDLTPGALTIVASSALTARLREMAQVLRILVGDERAGVGG